MKIIISDEFKSAYKWLKKKAQIVGGGFWECKWFVLTGYIETNALIYIQAHLSWRRVSFFHPLLLQIPFLSLILQSIMQIPSSLNGKSWRIEENIFNTSSCVISENDLFQRELLLLLLRQRKIRDAITLPCRFSYIGGSDGFTVILSLVVADHLEIVVIHSPASFVVYPKQICRIYGSRLPQARWERDFHTIKFIV